MTLSGSRCGARADGTKQSGERVILGTGVLPVLLLLLVHGQITEKSLQTGFVIRGHGDTTGLQIFLLFMHEFGEELIEGCRWLRDGMR